MNLIQLQNVNKLKSLLAAPHGVTSHSCYLFYTVESLSKWKLKLLLCKWSEKKKTDMNNTFHRYWVFSTAAVWWQRVNQYNCMLNKKVFPFVAFECSTSLAEFSPLVYVFSCWVGRASPSNSCQLVSVWCFFLFFFLFLSLMIFIAALWFLSHFALKS